MADQEVRTVFTVADRATGPMQLMARSAETLERRMGAAQGAAGGMPGLGMQGIRGAAIGRFSQAEQESLREALVESQARRLRSRQVRVHMQGEMASHRGLQAMSMLMMGQQKGFVGQLERTTGTLVMVGSQFATMGGTAGALGMKMAGLAGKVGLLAGAFEVGHAIGEGLNEGSELLHKQFEGMGETGKIVESSLMRFVPVLGPLYQVATAETRAHQEVIEANDRYARSLGFAGAAAYQAYRATTNQVDAATKHANHQLDLSKMMEGEAKQLGNLSAHPGFEERIALNDAMAARAKQLAAEGLIASADVDSALELMRSAKEKQSETANAVALLREQNALAIQVNFAAAQFEKQLDAMPMKTMAQQLSFTEAALKFAQQGAEAIGHAGDKDVIDKLMSMNMSRLEKQNVHVHNDYRNSRFDIKQAFAEGFDPDRVAVALNNGINAISERSRHGRGAPAFGTR